MHTLAAIYYWVKTCSVVVFVLNDIQWSASSSEGTCEKHLPSPPKEVQKWGLQIVYPMLSSPTITYCATETKDLREWPVIIITWGRDGVILTNVFITPPLDAFFICPPLLCTNLSVSGWVKNGQSSPFLVNWWSYFRMNIALSLLW